MKTKKTDEAPDKLGEISVKKNKTFDIIARIGCLILAFIIWYLVVSMDNTEYESSFSSIPVDISGDCELSVLSGTGSLVDVTVSGKRSVISKLEASDIKAYVSISGITTAGSYKLNISTELPNGVSLSSISSDSITVYLDNTVSTAVPVEIKLVNYMIEDGYELGESEASSSVSEVIVTGPEKALESISCARITLDLGHVTRSVTYTGGMALYDTSGNEVKNPYIKMQTTETTVTVPVYKLREVPLKLSYKYGYYNDSNSNVTINPSTVLLKGEVSAVDAVELKFDIDEKQITSDTTYKVNISLPDGIINVNGIESAEVSIKHIGTATKKIDIYQINAYNPNNLQYTVQTKKLSVNLRGNSSLLSTITEDDITAEVDLSAANQASGTVLVPVTFSFSDQYSGNVYELGTYSASVKIG